MNALKVGMVNWVLGTWDFVFGIWGLIDFIFETVSGIDLPSTGENL
jgi:hypothetical protein